MVKRHQPYKPSESWARERKRDTQRRTEGKWTLAKRKARVAITMCHWAHRVDKKNIWKYKYRWPHAQNNTQPNIKHSYTQTHTIIHSKKKEKLTQTDTHLHILSLSLYININTSPLTINQHTHTQTRMHTPCQRKIYFDYRLIL